MKRVLTIKELAETLGVSIPTAYRIARREDFPAVHLSQKRIVVPEMALNEWLTRQAAHRDA